MHPAYRLQLIDQSVAALDPAEAEEMLAFIAGNLLRGAIRALAFAPKAKTIQQLAGLLYQHLPEGAGSFAQQRRIARG